MLRTQDHKVQIELEDHIGDLFVRERVLSAHVREIRWGPDVFGIWCRLPCCMTSRMHHIVCAMALIWRLCDHARSTSYSEDEVHGSSHHDSPLPGASRE